MEFIIISGLSGAGKSKVASFLEDIGFYVVDNMPAPLMPKFAELYGMPLDAIIGMGTAINPYINNVSTLVLMAVVPFNILKGVVVSLLTMVLYKRVEKLLLRLGGH